MRSEDYGPAGVSFLLETSAQQLFRGVVVEVETSGTVTVQVSVSGSDALVRCHRLLVTEAAPLDLGAGDLVLVWLMPDVDDHGVVIGRIGPARRPIEPARDAVPDELVIEAKDQLVLRVGDGSITIRADGKILIKGKDLVSHAQNLNRIKGGAVAIN
jgi:hypothetical protein